MIVSVKSKSEFQKLIENKALLAYPEAFFISILNPDDETDLIPAKDNMITQRFYDLEYDVAENKAMSEEQAKELYDFILANKDKEVCYVHCSAGVSRSGAIGEFINDLYGLSWLTFKKMNPRISPNLHIKTLLNNLHYPR